MAKRNNRILVPEARQGLNQLQDKVMAEKGYKADENNSDKTKYEMAKDLGIPLEKGYNGNIKAKQAGKVGGNIGGQMVREMIQMAEQNLNNKR
jgi:hypothetical protein